MLARMERFVNAVNTDTVAHAIHDVSGKFVIPPYDGTDKTVVELPAAVYLRWRRYSWLNRENVVQETAELPAVPELMMRDIRARLWERGIKLPVGTTKASALALLTEADEKGQSDDT